MAEPSRLGIEHFFCHHSDCPDHGKRGHGNVYFRGWSGRDQRIRMVYCRTCKKASSERKGTALFHSHLPEEKALAVLQHLDEGCGIRSTGRLVGVDPNTVGRLARIAGQHAHDAHDELVAFSPSDP